LSDFKLCYSTFPSLFCASTACIETFVFCVCTVFPFLSTAFYPFPIHCELFVCLNVLSPGTLTTAFPTDVFPFPICFAPSPPSARPPVTSCLKLVLQTLPILTSPVFPKQRRLCLLKLLSSIGLVRRCSSYSAQPLSSRSASCYPTVCTFVVCCSATEFFVTAPAATFELSHPCN